MAADGATIDLVLATVGRASELERFLASIEGQSYRNVRVIVVDQNADDRLSAVLPRYEQTLSILHLRAPPGLSRARNLGLEHVSGDVVAFPDDDCWYPPDLLQSVVSTLDAHPEWGGLCVPARDDRGRSSTMLWDRSPGLVGRYSMWRRVISIGIFLRASTVSTVGQFAADLGLGSGTRWGSGEESDYVLRALAAGVRLHYEPSLHVGHESPNPVFGQHDRGRAYLGGLGHGHVLRLHAYPPWFVAFRVAQLVAGAAAFLVTGRPAKARFYFMMAMGRAAGWLSTHHAG